MKCFIINFAMILSLLNIITFDIISFYYVNQEISILLFPYLVESY